MIGDRLIDHALYHRVETQLRQLENQTELRAPVYVLSRHRAGKTKTTQLLEKSLVPFKLIVEPHDYPNYAKHHNPDDLITLPEDDFGIANVRNWILDHAKENGWLYAWQIDDDISQFVYRRNGERIPTMPRPLMSIVEQFTFAHDNVAGSCIPNQAFIFGFDDKPPLVYNGMIYQMQLLRTDTGIRWRPNLPNDPDRTLQLLTSGWTTIVPRRFGQHSPSPMKQPGGLTDTEYAHDGRLIRFQNLVNAWPNAYRIGYMKDGTPKLISLKPFQKFATHPKPIRNPRWKI